MMTRINFCCCGCADVLARRRLRASRSQVIQATKAARSRRIELETLLSDWVLSAQLIREDLDVQQQQHQLQAQQRLQMQQMQYQQRAAGANGTGNGAANGNGATGANNLNTAGAFDMFRRVHNLQEAMANSGSTINNRISNTNNSNQATNRRSLSELFAPFRRNGATMREYEEDMLTTGADQIGNAATDNDGLANEGVAEGGNNNDMMVFEGLSEADLELEMQMQLLLLADMQARLAGNNNTAAVPSSVCTQPTSTVYFN
jgi:hypothetical protein